MTKSHTGKDFTLRGLELFQLVAKRGSLKAVAQEAGVSVSTVSHHLKALEDSLGVDLFNHTRRPLTLSPIGQRFLDNIDDALLTIREARAEASAGDGGEIRMLRIGAIEDFDSDIIPELAVYLSKRMPNCDLTFQTDSSLQIINALKHRKLEMGISTCPSDTPADLTETLLLKDPFVVLLPPDSEAEVERIFAGKSDLPFIRFPSTQIIARQIEAHLRRMGHSFPRRFESGNNQTQMALVAAGAGWSITTPLLFSRGRRFHDQLRMYPFPGKSFSRNLAVYATPDCPTAILNMATLQLRALVESVAIGRVHSRAPWLKGSFHLL